jgi:hypothetical protein
LSTDAGKRRGALWSFRPGDCGLQFGQWHSPNASRVGAQICECRGDRLWGVVVQQGMKRLKPLNFADQGVAGGAQDAADTSTAGAFFRGATAMVVVYG